MPKFISSRSRVAWITSPGLMLTLPPMASAQLEWAATEIRQEQSLDDPTFHASFSCRNAGEYPLYVRRIVVREQGIRANVLGGGKTLQPGDSREVVLRGPNRLLFEESEISAEVQTDEWNAESVRLQLHRTPRGWSGMDAAARAELKAKREAIAEMPSPVQLDPRFLVWSVDPGQTPTGGREINILFAPGYEAEVTGLIPSGGSEDAFSARLEVVEAGRLYRVIVEPATPEATQASEVAGFTRPAVAVWRVETSLQGDARQRALLEGPLVIRAMTRPTSHRFMSRPTHPAEAPAPD